MKILIADRQRGKTVQLMEWVEEGKRCDGYPGWTRVAIVATMERLEYVRSIWWETLPDFSHRVYALPELQENSSLSFSWNTLFRFDDMDEVIRRVLPGFRIDGFTITGEEWKI